MALSRAVDSADAVVLFADLQPALVRNSRTNPPAMIAAGAAALADAGELLGWPFLFSVVPEDGGPATPLPELAALATQNRLFTRRCASPFGDAGFVAALEATGRRTLVLAAYSAEAVVWTLFGGAGTLYGALIGTGILIYLKETLSSQWAYTYQIALGVIIIIVVTFVLARMQSGIMEASATRNPSRPCTLLYWSTTAMLSDGGPILQVAEAWWLVETTSMIHLSKVASLDRSASVGAMRSAMISR